MPYQQLRRTAIHEAGHAVVGEILGIRIERATAVPTATTDGSVNVAGLRPETHDMGVVLASGYAAIKARDMDDAGDHAHRTDFDQLDALCRRLAKSHEHASRLWEEAHARAYEIVRDPRTAYLIECVADELVSRAERGFGMGSLQIGAVIAEARAEYDARRRLYGMTAPGDTLTGSTPSEELAIRKATLEKMGAQTALKATGRKPSHESRSSATSRWYIATEDATVMYDGKRERIIKGVTGVSADHEWARRYPSKFAPDTCPVRELPPRSRPGG